MRIVPAVALSDAAHTIASLVSVIELSSDAIFTQGRDGAILTWNRSSERLWGWGPSEVLGQPAGVLFAPHVEQATQQLLQRALTGEVVEDIELEARRRDGMRVPVSVSVLPTVDGLGEIRGASTIVRDVSEQKLAQSTLAESEARLQEAQALAHVGIWLWDGVTGTVQWSDELHRIHGVTPRDFDGTYAGHLAGIVAADRDHVDGALTAALRAGRPVQLEYRIVRPGGEVRWVTSRGEVTRDGAGVPVGLRGICQDVTDAKRAEEALRDQAALLQLVGRIAAAANEAEDLPDALWSCLAEVCDHTGWPVGRVSFADARTGRGEPELWHVADPARGLPLRRSLENHPSTLAGRVWETGQAAWGEAQLAPGGMSFAFPVLVGREVAAVLEYFSGQAGPPDAALLDAMSAAGIQLGRVLERTRAEEALSHQALHDPLTRLPNRALFLNRLHHALSRAGRETSLLAVLFLDLDGFKVVNDSLGHETGDALLLAVARRLEGVLRVGDTIARFGGDEFTVLCEDLSGEEEALTIAERLAGALNEPIPLSPGGEVVISTSIGVAFSSGPGDVAERLVRDADMAMYRAKEQGRARCEIFDVGMHARATYKLEVVKDLRLAGELGQLALAYQPQVTLDGGAVVGVEALLRWRHPVRGLLAPAEFIPLAEESQLIGPIGTWVLREACSQLAAWTADPTAPPLKLCVNVSARQLAQGDLAATVSSVLADTGIDPGALCLEITESILMEDADFFVGALHRLKDVGVSLAVDDFGMGYSALAYLKRFPMDMLKLDRAFVEGLGRGDPRPAAIVRAVVELARALDLTSVAEGVETSEQADDLRALRCELAQGYWFGRPQTPGEIGALLQRRSGPRP